MTASYICLALMQFNSNLKQDLQRLETLLETKHSNKKVLKELNEDIDDKKEKIQKTKEFVI